MKQAILSIEDIAFRYDSRRAPALNQISFAIEPGTITAILGPNGAGKTTLLHVLLGLSHPDAGLVRLDGRPLEQYTRRELSRWMGLVPQSEHVAFDYTVLEFTLLGRAPYLDLLDLPQEEDLEIARQAIYTVGISELTLRPVSELSGGELQLVLIARALAQQPKILLLDEPTSHLDLSNRDVTLSILKRLRADGATVLFSTHDPDAAALAADNLVLMRQGKILYTGGTKDTFTSEKLSQTYGVGIEVVPYDGVFLVKSQGLIH